MVFLPGWHPARHAIDSLLGVKHHVSLIAAYPQQPWDVGAGISLFCR